MTSLNDQSDVARRFFVGFWFRSHHPVEWFLASGSNGMGLTHVGRSLMSAPNINDRPGQAGMSYSWM